VASRKAAAAIQPSSFTELMLREDCLIKRHAYNEGGDVVNLERWRCGNIIGAAQKPI
jgi:hypothetical protein